MTVSFFSRNSKIRNSNMPKKEKRKNDDSIMHDRKRMKRSEDSLDDSRVVLIAIGSSSGNFPASMEEALKASTFSKQITLVFPKEKIYGMNGATTKVVMQLTELLLRTAKKYPKRKIFFVTSSFGGRAAAHVISQRVENRKGKTNEEKHPHLKTLSKIPKNFAGIVSFGYPLIHKSDDRTHILKLLECPILFLVGSKDKLCDIKRLESLINTSMSCDANLHIVEGGKHNPFDIVPKSSNSDKKITNLALRKIGEFIN